jgi:hypothetical protein
MFFLSGVSEKRPRISFSALFRAVSPRFRPGNPPPQKKFPAFSYVTADFADISSETDLNRFGF